MVAIANISHFIYAPVYYGAQYITMHNDFI